MYVLYEDAGKLKAETIFSSSDTSLQVESASGKRSKVKNNAVLFKFEQPDAHELLPAAQALADTLEVDFLWECAPQAEFDVASLAEEYFGHAPSTIEKTALLLALSAAPAYFHRRGRGLFKPAPPEILQAALAAIEKKRQAAAQQQAWCEQILAGQLPEQLRPVAAGFLERPDKNSLEWKAFNAAVEQSGQNPERLLLALGVWPNPLVMMRERFFSKNFPNGTGWPAHAALPVPADLPVAQVQAYSIDDANTFEIDDALSVEPIDATSVRVGIHIAVPALAITRASALDLSARQRMATVYMPGQKIPMLPPTVIQQFSLDAGALRPCLSLYIEGRTDSGEILTSETRLEQINVRQNLRHADFANLTADTDLSAPDCEVAHSTWFLPLWRFAMARCRVRDQIRGKPENNDRIEYSFELDGPPDDPNSQVRLLARARNAPIERMVAEYMILANNQWAALLDKHGVPGIFRTQQGGRTRMSTHALPHEAIAVSHYAWCSSPLRRYADLVNQGQVLAAAEHGVSARLVAPYKPKDAELFAIIGAFDAQYGVWGDFQAAIERYWCLRWLQQQGLQQVQAQVLRDNLVRLDCAPLVTRVGAMPELERGQSVLLQIMGYDELGLELDCRYLQTL